MMRAQTENYRFGSFWRASLICNQGLSAVFRDTDSSTRGLPMFQNVRTLLKVENSPEQKDNDN